MLRAKLGDHIGKGETLFEIYAGRNTKLNTALELADKLQPIRLSKKPEERMLIKRVLTRTAQRKTCTPKR